MTYEGTITSKRQLTIPAKLFRKLGLYQGEKVHIKEEDGSVVVTPLVKMVKELSGSVKLPEKYQGKDIDQIISESK
jgi:AbrB family looped-hinge helix DNA binding protein